MAYDEGDVIYRPPGGGSFINGPNGSIVWDDGTVTGGKPWVSAPAEALAYFAMFCVSLAENAVKNCGAGQVGSATAALGWAVLWNSYSDVEWSLRFLLDCAFMHGEDGTPEY